ncbi:tyrosine-type recombinase/integrase [PVC group bacterium]|nr:tyrosine-type recombinase/integrase [PVC group bacterium]
MKTICFSGPLSSELADFTATLEASATANKAMLTLLRALDRVTDRRVLPLGTIDEAFARAWLAPCDSRGPNTLLSRYHLLRRFCRFLAKRRPQTFIPGESLRPRRRPAALPHIYTREEIRSLLDGALSLRDWERWHPCPIRSKTMHAIILLLVTAGLRISEALHLTWRDVNLEVGMLSIWQSKFRKSRIVPLSTGTTDVLRDYCALRDAVAPTGPDEAFFVSGRGKAYSPGYVGQMFRNIAVEAGLRSPTGRGPRLHDLRATFAVTRLLEWYRDGDNVMNRLPLLSTYLGHACVSDTEVYLRITTALLEQANTRFHAFARDVLPAGGVS